MCAVETAVLEGNAFSPCTQQHGNELRQLMSTNKRWAAFPTTEQLSIFGTFRRSVKQTEFNARWQSRLTSVKLTQRPQEAASPTLSCLSLHRTVMGTSKLNTEGRTSAQLCWLSQQGRDPRGHRPSCAIHLRALSSRCAASFWVTERLRLGGSHTLPPGAFSQEKPASLLFLSWVPIHSHPVHAIKVPDPQGSVWGPFLQPLAPHTHWFSRYLFRTSVSQVGRL